MHKIYFFLLFIMPIIQADTSFDKESIYIINNLPKTLYIKLFIDGQPQTALQTFDTSEIVEDSRIFEFPPNTCTNVRHIRTISSNLIIRLWPRVFHHFRGKDYPEDYAYKTYTVKKSNIIMLTDQNWRYAIKDALRKCPKKQYRPRCTLLGQENLNTADQIALLHFTIKDIDSLKNDLALAMKSLSKITDIPKLNPPFFETTQEFSMIMPKTCSETVLMSKKESDDLTEKISAAVFGNSTT